MNRAIIAIALFSCCWLAVARQHRGEEYGGYKYISSCKLRYAPEVPPYDYDKGNMQSSPELGEEAVDADAMSTSGKYKYKYRHGHEGHGKEYDHEAPYDSRPDNEHEGYQSEYPYAPHKCPGLKPNYALDDGEQCLQNSDCCSGVCNDDECCAIGKRPNGLRCNNDLSCCSGACRNQTCVASRNATLAPCSSNVDCVSGFCSFTSSTCCRDQKSSCLTGDECCSGNCDKFPNDEVDPRYGQCCAKDLKARFAVCASSAECCSKHCIPAANSGASSICCAKDTKGFGESCNLDCDCCSNSCKSGKCANPE